MCAARRAFFAGTIEEIIEDSVLGRGGKQYIADWTVGSELPETAAATASARRLPRSQTQPLQPHRSAAAAPRLPDNPGTHNVPLSAPAVFSRISKKAFSKPSGPGGRCTY